MKLLIFLAHFCYLVQGLLAQKSWTKNEFKYLIEAGKVECFYQYVETDSVFHASIQVLKGNDVSFYILDANQTIIYHLLQKQSGSHQVQKSIGQGDYKLCIDNQYSFLTDKLVYLYILTFQSEKMLARMKETQEFNETATFTKQTLDRIYLQMIEAYTHQALSRFKQSRDEYILVANNTLILYWSLFQSFLIILCGMFQVYFIKRLFQSSGKKFLK